MWTKITFEGVIRYGEGKRVLLEDEAYISLANATGLVLHFDDGARLAVVSRFQAKPYDVDDDCVDGETIPVVTPLAPEFFLWED